MDAALFQFSQDPVALVVGPPEGDRVSVIYAVAFDAVQKGKSVVLITTREASARCLPTLTAEADERMELFEKVGVKYADTVEELAYVVGNLHLLPDYPDLLLVNDIREYFGAQLEKHPLFPRTIAVFVAGLKQPEKQSRAVLFDWEDPSMPHFYAYEMWASSIFRLLPSPGGDQVLSLISLHRRPPAEPVPIAVFKTHRGGLVIDMK